MKEGWTTRWKALFLWLCGYLSIIAFAVTGGYVIVKSENEELKKTVKKVFIVTLIFTAISMFFSVYNGIGNMTDNYYNSDAYTAYSYMTRLADLAEVAVFAICGALAFFKGGAGAALLADGKKGETTGNETREEDKAEEPAKEDEA